MIARWWRRYGRAAVVALFLAGPMPVAADHNPTHSAAGAAPSVLEKLLSFGGGAAQQQFLDPEVAFVMDARVRDAQTIVVRWVLADEYYLYKEKFSFALRESSVAALGTPQLPAGQFREDPYFGRQEVYYGQVEAVIPIQRHQSAGADVTLEVGYQGCADAGLCYPPTKKQVALQLPPGLAGAAQVSGLDSPAAALTTPLSSGPLPAGELPEQDRIARTLAGGVSWLVLATFFGFGLLLTFTPCVFPMVPILSSIIVGQGENITTRRAFTLSLTYVLSMAVAYTAAGVAAGLFGAGANLQAAFQDPWILSVFIVMFVLLALSMFGFYDLQIPASWQTRLIQVSNRQRSGTYVGVAVMGVLSALIVGPCVAAPLAGALIYIGQTGDAMLGGMALFALSLGMGTPVLIVGTSGGRLLPRAGAWMKPVKAAFGVALLGVAIYLLERIVPEQMTLLLWAALLIIPAIYMGALDSLGTDANGWRKLWKGTGVLMAVYGAALVIGAAVGGGDLYRPLKGLSGGLAGGGNEAPLPFRPVKGVAGLQVALANAASQGQPAMLDFYADWCVSCKELERTTLSDPAVRAALAGAVLLRTDVTANDEHDQELLRTLRLFGPPALLFFDTNGKERPEFRVVGYIEAREFEAHVRRAVSSPTGSLARATSP